VSARRERIEERLARRGGALELLRLPAALFGSAVRLRGALYDRGLLPVARLACPVVSVGNLTAGGTGKTPFVAFLARELARRGRRPGILSRGYKASGGGTNDEALELAQLLPGVPHVQDPDRVRGGETLLREHAVDVVLLDDGFQHRRLARDLDLVLVDATRPFGLPRDPREPSGGDGVRALLPRGLLREHPDAARRAHAWVVTRSDQVERAELERLVAELERLAPGLPVLRAVHRPLRLVDARGARRPLSSLEGREVDLVSGIANPDAFRAQVAGLGARVRSERCFPDHHAYSAADAAELARLADGGGGPLVCTQKDAVKLVPLGLECLSLQVELALVSGAPVLEALLDALPRSQAERERAALHEGLAG
jgi:tetraacyldisaccharide 4'-kinase